MDNSKTDELRKRLAGALDQGFRSETLKSAEAVRGLLKGIPTRTSKNAALITVLQDIYESAERGCPGAADSMFDAEIERWEARKQRWEERKQRLHEVSKEAADDTRFVHPFAVIRQEAVGHGGFHRALWDFASAFQMGIRLRILKKADRFGAAHQQLS
jgi:hypothetical protein